MAVTLTSITERNESSGSSSSDDLAADAGVVDEHVDRARTCRAVVADEALPVVGIATGRRARRRHRSRSPASASSRSARRAATHDAGADGVEHPGEPLAEARRGAGDHGDLAVEAEEGERVERGGRRHGAERRSGPMPRSRARVFGCICR